MRALALLLLLAGCGHGGGAPSGAACPPAAAAPVTYETFGRVFLQSYCVRCHGSTVIGAARLGAPSDHNLDSLADLRTHRDHVDERAAIGPAAQNRAMPPSAPLPSDDERRRLAEWLACGAP